MDIAFVSNVVYPFVTGGAQKRIHEIGTRLADRGHDVTIYGRHFWDGPETKTYQGLTLRAVAPPADLYEGEGRRSITEAIDFSVRLLPVLNKHVDRHDVIVASVFPYFPVLSAKLCGLSDTPLITTWHEVWRDYWEEYLGSLSLGGKAVERLTASIPQHPIAVSGITAERLSTLGRNRESITVVPNGIDVAQIRNTPIPEPAAQKSFDVLFAGRLIADKNVSMLLDAFDSVAGEYDATLGVIGDGPEFDRLQHQTENLRHGDRVRFLGFVDEYEDVLGHMRAANVFASPSTREGFGITYLEAMAAGCVAIGVQHPESAASEVIGDAGYLAEPTVESLAERLERALAGQRPANDPVERAERFDWDEVATQAESAYERAVDGSW